MNIEFEILEINEKLNKIWAVIQYRPGITGLAKNVDYKTKELNRNTSKDEIRKALIKAWNIKHPLYKIDY